MSSESVNRKWQRVGLATGILLTPILLVAAVMFAFGGNAMASSHREAPLISKDAFADNTDTYVWMSKDKNVVLAALWIPFEGPEGGPNYWEWDDNALYDIYVDNDGDAMADITYTLSSYTTIVSPTGTFLYNTGPIGADGTNWNRRQYYTVTETLADGTMNVLVGNKLAAPVNIGEKSTGNYATLEQNAISSNGDVKIFAGQSDDPFFVDLQVFDLLTLRGNPSPIGYLSNNVPVDSVSGFNAHALVIEAPPTRMTDGDPVLGVWAGTRRPSMTVLAADGSAHIQYKQVSRLGMPLVNEVVLPMGLKDTFNSISPDVDLTVYGLLQKSVEDPEIGTLLCAIYGMPLPEDTNADCHTEYTTPASGRGDIFDIFLRGIKLARPFTITIGDGSAFGLPIGYNVNRPQNAALPTFDGVTPAEMIRINTTISGTLCSPTPQRLGILAGDACGFPNGRRLTDDVVEIELLAVGGAAYSVLEGKDYTIPEPYFTILANGDNVNHNDVPLRDTFPYLAPAQSGQAHMHQNPLYTLLLPLIQKSMDAIKDFVPGWMSF